MYTYIISIKTYKIIFSILRVLIILSDIGDSDITAIWFSLKKDALQEHSQGAGEMVETVKCSRGTGKGTRVQLSGTYIKEQGHMPCVCNPSA